MLAADSGMSKNANLRDKVKSRQGWARIGTKIATIQTLQSLESIEGFKVKGVGKVFKKM